MAKHWYRVEMQAGSETHCYFGSSALAEPALMTAINEGRFVSLDDLTYYDEDGEPRPWTGWDPNAYPRIHLNGQYIITIIPLMDDPRKREGGASNNVLAYPGSGNEDPTD